MADEGGGAIILLGSSAGLHTARRQAAAYTTSKAGLLGLVRSAAPELAPFNVRINAIIAANLEGETSPEQAAQVPLGRLGKPEEVAQAMLFLASEAAAFITGQALVLDGGWAASSVL
ncbi:MAG: SDR family oxidoreductase [Anaerolineae bacterium]|nr:SDR family oxidoreductase [Anaerolineae bacterium]